MPLLRSWNVLSWNIRGLNSEPKQLALHNAIVTSGCAIVCLQETKKTSFDLAFIKSCCPRQFNCFAFMPSHGASGGIITIWKSSMFTGSVLFSDHFALVVNFTSTQSRQTWTLANIYGPCTGDERVTYTNWLYELDIPASQAWLLLGDFNYIRAPDIAINLAVVPLTCSHSMTLSVRKTLSSFQLRAEHIRGATCNLIPFSRS